jgi:hypothetical protein
MEFVCSVEFEWNLYVVVNPNSITWYKSSAFRKRFSQCDIFALSTQKLQFLIIFGTIALQNCTGALMH